MAERGRKPKEYPPGKRPVYVTIMIAEEALNLLPKDKSRSKAIEHAIYITYGKPSQLQYDELIIQREKLVEQLEKAMEHQRHAEKEVSEIQNQLQYIDNRLKELDDAKREEKDDLYFAVFMLRKAVHIAINNKMWKEQFFNEIGIEFNYNQFIKDFYKNYEEILTSSEDEVIQKYNVKFDRNKVKNKDAYEKYHNEYKSIENKGSSEKSNSESKVENKIETTNPSEKVNNYLPEEIVCIIREKIVNDIREGSGWLKDLLNNRNRFELYRDEFKGLGIKADFEKMFSDIVNKYEYFQNLSVEEFISQYKIEFSEKDITSPQEFEILKERCQQKLKNIQENPSIDNSSSQGGDQ